MSNKSFQENINKAKNLEAKTEFMLRNNDLAKNMVYPWINHDYDYQQYVKNNYTPEKMGISSEPCINVTIKDAINIPKYINASIFDGIPSVRGKAGYDDVDPANKELINIKKQYNDFKEPYPGFINEYSEFFPQGLEGENASSYFIHTGYCPTKIDSYKTCHQKGYKWIPNPVSMPIQTSDFFPKEDVDEEEKNRNLKSVGGCYKPRYSYVNNKAGDVSGLFKGLVPTIGKDILQLNPVSFMNIIMNGSSPTGDFSQLPCREEFRNGNRNKIKNKNKNNHYLCQFMLICCLVSIILYMSLKLN